MKPSYYNTDNNQINGLLLLRVISVTMILIVHFGQSISLPEILHTPIVWCRHGVQMFYLLSGYLIFASLTKKHNILQFYKKRVVRIVPIYWAVVIVNIILFDGILSSVPDDTLGLGWWRYFLFLQTMIPSISVDFWNNISALWTMSAFALFYFVAPILWKISKRGVIMCVVCIVSVFFIGLVVSTFYDYLNLPEIYADSLLYIKGKNAVSQLWIFAVGGGIFLVRESKWSKFVLPMFFALLGLIYHKETITMVCCFAVIIAAVGSEFFTPSNRWLKVLRILDKYSFAIYLGHTTIIEFISSLRNIYHLSTPVVGLCSIIGSIILIWCLHNYVEKPTARYFSLHSKLKK